MDTIQWANVCEGIDSESYGWAVNASFIRVHAAIYI
jgi:hypothetical protein